jgi:hypothetical protein
VQVDVAAEISPQLAVDLQYADGAWREWTPILIFVAICVLSVVVFSRRARTMAEEI